MVVVVIVQVAVVKSRPELVNNKLEARASKNKFGPRAAKHKLEPGLVNTYSGPGLLNTNWGPGPVNTNWGPGLINTYRGPDFTDYVEDFTLKHLVPFEICAREICEKFKQ